MANTKLLLVEDDENLAYMEKSCFEDIIGGYEVKTAVNGKEGLKVWPVSYTHLTLPTKA